MAKGYNEHFEFSRHPLHLTLGGHYSFPKLLMIGWYWTGSHHHVKFHLSVRRRVWTKP